MTGSVGVIAEGMTGGEAEMIGETTAEMTGVVVDDGEVRVVYRDVRK